MSNFKDFKTALKTNFSTLTKEHNIFYQVSVDKDELWNKYLDSFPEGTNPIFKKRREYDCGCCRHFIKNYGNVVAVDKNNKLISIWDFETGDYTFNTVAKAMDNFVKSKQIENVFVSKIEKLGTEHNFDMDGIKYEHFSLTLPKNFVMVSSDSIESIHGSFRDNKNVFKRSMDELTLDAGLIILDLINQNSIYRGAEFKSSITTFIDFKTKYISVKNDEKDNWAWKNSIKIPISKIRNTAIGTLLIDISEGVEVDIAVTKFEKVVAPTNYKRPKAIITKTMIDNAEKKIKEMGFESSLERRFATSNDITINNTIFVNRTIKNKLKNSIFDDLKVETPINNKKFNKVEEISIEDFIKKVIPTTNDIELFVESKHESNFMSLIAPKNADSKTMFKWNNNFSWCYNGDITDSVKQRVKAAGGDITGDLRFSIQWNELGDNQNDFDAHAKLPTGAEINFSTKTHTSTSGKLDVDIIFPQENVAVENITWPSKLKLIEGDYVFYVHCFSHRGGRSGFRAEIEFDGEIYNFSYDHDIPLKDSVIVATVNYSKKNGFTMKSELPNSQTSKTIWGIKTNTFTKVPIITYSPNFWDNQTIGNKHYFFILDGCLNTSKPRGFFNEFLTEELMSEKRVFEILGSKMAVENDENQLSGIGFSSTQKNDIIANIKGNINRTLKIIF